MIDGARLPEAYACKFCGGPLLGTADGWTYCERNCTGHRGLQMQLQEHTIGANGGTFLSLVHWDELMNIINDMAPYADYPTKEHGSCPCCETGYCNCHEGILRVQLWRKTLIALLTNDNIRETPNGGGKNQQVTDQDGGKPEQPKQDPDWGAVGDPQIG